MRVGLIVHKTYHRLMSFCLCLSSWLIFLRSFIQYFHDKQCVGKQQYYYSKKLYKSMIFFKFLKIMITCPIELKRDLIFTPIILWINWNNMWCIITLNSGSEAFLPSESKVQSRTFISLFKISDMLCVQNQLFLCYKNIYLHNLCFYSLIWK